MVDHVRTELEWSLLPTPSTTARINRDGLRCLRGMGMWSMVQSVLVPNRWNKQALDLQIAVKELIPIVVAAATWGKQWYRMRVICHCDNQVVIACLRSRTSKQDHIMHLLRCLVFFEACYQFSIQPQYINTVHNHLADDLSRNCLSSFLSKVPQASRHPSTPPPGLLTLLLDPRIDWTSPRWHQQFGSTFSLDWPPPPSAPMLQH